MRLLLLAMLLCGGTIAAAADEETNPNAIVPEGRISLGAELDESGLPTNKPKTKSTPSRLRVGVAATWSLSLKWERVDPQPDAAAADPLNFSAEELKLVELTNTERKKQNLQALRPDPTLMKLAREHSANMARLDQIGHELEGKTFSQRMEQAKYLASRAGEIIAEGQRTPADAVSSWMSSPGHKGNILQSDYTRIGVASATSKSGKKYWTQVFAKP